MTFGRYLREHFYWLLGGLFLILTILIFLLTIKGSIYLMIYVAAAISLVISGGLYVDYRRQKRIYGEVNEKLEQLEKKYLIPEVVNLPDTQEAEALIHILKQSEQAMANETASYRRETEDYKAYIETWVHEVKIPLATSKMILENHREDPIEDSGIEEEIDRIEQYVEQAMYYSRSSDVEKDYFIREIDLSDLVKNTVRRRKKALIAGHASIRIEIPELPKKPKSDAKWLEFILGQLIDNSIKYAKENEPLTLTFSAEERSFEGEQHICLILEDNGIGIKSSELSRIFEKGFTGTNGRRGKASTGIGLYLCRKLCRRLGHELLIESEEGIGTTARIVL